MVGQAIVEGDLWNSIPGLTTHQKLAPSLRASCVSYMGASSTPIRRTRSVQTCRSRATTGFDSRRSSFPPSRPQVSLARGWARGPGAAIVGAIFSALLLVLNSYTKKYDLGELAQKHRQASSAGTARQVDPTALRSLQGRAEHELQGVQEGTRGASEVSTSRRSRLRTLRQAGSTCSTRAQYVSLP
jgi:hypothetical protein